MSLPHHCPALLISAPASGQGKTTVTAALACKHHDQGRRVRVFKTGPDFLDPMILERASGNPVYQLDLWMVGETQCRQLLYDAASDADLILIEGVMGLCDGEPSSTDLAAHFGIPVLGVIDAFGFLYPANLDTLTANDAMREAIYRSGRLTASYMHHYFGSNPAAAAALFAP